MSTPSYCQTCGLSARLYRHEVDRLREANANLLQALARADQRISELADLLDDEDLLAEVAAR